MKAIIAGISLCFLHFASAGLVLDDIDVSHISRTVKRPEAVCRLAAYASAVECTHRNEITNETLDEILECMSEVVTQYLHCTETDAPELNGRRSLSDLVQNLKNNVLGSSSDYAADTEISTEDLDKMSLSEIRCIVDNILDLIKCVVDAELVDKVPFKWDWAGFTKCVISNIPTYITCFKSKA